MSFSKFNGMGNALFNLITISNLSIGRAYASCVRYSDNYILLFGGFSNDDFEPKELDIIERYDIDNDSFQKFSISLPFPVYGSISFMKSSTEVIICGGKTKEKILKKSFSINLVTTKIENSNDLPIETWSIMPPFYFNGTIHIFLNGEDENKLPDLVTFNTILG